MAKLIPLEQVYLAAIAAYAELDKLDCLLQDIKDGHTGRLFLCRINTTVPEAQIAFTFELDSVTFGIQTRDERSVQRVVKYAEGVDGFLEELAAFLRAGRLPAPKRGKPLGPSLADGGPGDLRVK